MAKYLLILYMLTLSCSASYSITKDKDIKKIKIASPVIVKLYNGKEIEGEFYSYGDSLFVIKGPTDYFYNIERRDIVKIYWEDVYNADIWIGVMMVIMIGCAIYTDRQGK